MYIEVATRQVGSSRAKLSNHWNCEIRIITRLRVCRNTYITFRGGIESKAIL
uniref:Uncharacterized protein n=1 Tax=Vitis vinifera TaxID=29760 RepID=F6GTI7_VITVI